MLKKYLLLAVLGMLVGCAPYIDSRREAGHVDPVGQSKPDRVAICYNSWWTDEAELKTMAEAQCDAAQKKAVFADTKYFNCRLFTPNTAFYKCQ